jgi:hypothetical protein
VVGGAGAGGRNVVEEIILAVMGGVVWQHAWRRVASWSAWSQWIVAVDIIVSRRSLCMATVKLSINVRGPIGAEVIVGRAELKGRFARDGDDSASVRQAARRG